MLNPHQRERTRGLAGIALENEKLIKGLILVKGILYLWNLGIQIRNEENHINARKESSKIKPTVK